MKGKVWEVKEEVVKLRNADSLEDVKVFATVKEKIGDNGLEYSELTLYILESEVDGGIIKELRNANEKLMGQWLDRFWGDRVKVNGKNYRKVTEYFNEDEVEYGYAKAMNTLANVVIPKIKAILEEYQERKEFVEKHKEEKYIIY